MPFLARLWRTAPLLVVTGGLLAVLILPFGVGLLVDPRVITGAPAWLKPTKFAVSIAIYSVTMAWFFTFIPEWIRTRRLIGWATAFAMVVEMAIIGSQAYRGTTSHFNRATPYDAALFGIMGLVIVTQTLASISIAVALWRQRFADNSLGWALRLGMALTIVGAMTGGMMARPTATQIAGAKAGQQMTVAGAHTIGGPDGGPGMAGTGWSREHGDLRIAHFVGLHAMQALPFFALVLSRRKLSSQARTQLVVIAGTSYAALYVILVIEALRGIPLMAPDATTILQLGIWATATVTAAAVTVLDSAQAARSRSFEVA